MNRKRLVYILLLIAFAGVVAFFWRKPSSVNRLTQTELKPLATTSPSPLASTKSVSAPRPTPVRPDLAKAGVPEPHEPDPSVFNAFLSGFGTAIHFYGKVIDEKGNPIGGATATFVPYKEIDPNKQNPEYSAVSDGTGLFSISGISGAGLNVNVSKPGYYRMPPFDGHRGSYGSFEYGGVGSSNSSGPPTADDPAIFMLRKRGEGTALVHWGRSISIDMHGTPQVVSLATGSSTTQGDLSVQCWADNQHKDNLGHYSWHCQISVLGGGGLVSRLGEFDFEAPETGYQKSDSIAPPQDRWSPQGQRQYFVKTGDDHYARVTVHLIANGDHFVTIETYFNPQASSRKLEPASTAQQ